MKLCYPSKSTENQKIIEAISDNPKCANFKCHNECDEGCWGDGELSCVKEIENQCKHCYSTTQLKYSKFKKHSKKT